MSVSQKLRKPEETRNALVNATVQLMLQQGFTATTVDQICKKAGLTKGSFFHYFESKEAIGKAALDWFAAMGSELYSAAWQEPDTDPLAQIHKLFDIMISFTQIPGEQCLCMVGMISQEMAGTNSLFRDACTSHLSVWSEMMVRLLTEAKAKHAPKAKFDPERVAWFLNSLWQGSMLIAKTRQTPEMIASNIELARDYVAGLFDASELSETTSKKSKTNK